MWPLVCRTNSQANARPLSKNGTYYTRQIQLTWPGLAGFSWVCLGLVRALVKDADLHFYKLRLELKFEFEFEFEVESTYFAY